MAQRVAIIVAESRRSGGQQRVVAAATVISPSDTGHPVRLLLQPAVSSLPGMREEDGRQN